MDNNSAPFHAEEKGGFDHDVHHSLICPELHFQSITVDFHLSTSQTLHYFHTADIHDQQK